MLWQMNCKTEMVVGWVEEELWVVRSACGRILVRREFGLWINRIRVDCEAMCASLCCWNDYEVLKCNTCKSLPFYVMKMHYGWEYGHLTTNISRVLKLMIAMTNSKQWPILAIQTLFGSEPAWMGKSLKCFYKGVSCMISDFTRRDNKFISRYSPHALNWLR